MEPSAYSLVRYFSAAIIFLAGAVAIAVSVTVYKDYKTESSLKAEEFDAQQASLDCLADKHCGPSSFHLKLASELDFGDDKQRELASRLANRAADIDPNDPETWTLIARLEAQNAGGMSPQASDALRRSIELCWVCDNQDLLRERLELVLKNWDTAPEDVRIAAFEGAELLRWKYQDEDFLTAQDDFAVLKNIPFDAYIKQMAAPMKPDERVP